MRQALRCVCCYCEAKRSVEIRKRNSEDVYSICCRMYQKIYERFNLKHKYPRCMCCWVCDPNETFHSIVKESFYRNIKHLKVNYIKKNYFNINQKSARAQIQHIKCSQIEVTKCEAKYRIFYKKIHILKWLIDYYLWTFVRISTRFGKFDDPAYNIKRVDQVKKTSTNKRTKNGTGTSARKRSTKKFFKVHFLSLKFFVSNEQLEKMWTFFLDSFKVNLNNLQTIIIIRLFTTSNDRCALTKYSYQQPEKNKSKFQKRKTTKKEKITSDTRYKCFNWFWHT